MAASPTSAPAAALASATETRNRVLSAAEDDGAREIEDAAAAVALLRLREEDAARV
jgi:hypothetical protein